MPAEENLSGTQPSPPICAAEDAFVLSWQSWLVATETVWLAELKLSNYYLALHRKSWLSLALETQSGYPILLQHWLLCVLAAKVVTMTARGRS